MEEGAKQKKCIFLVVWYKVIYENILWRNRPLSRNRFGDDLDKRTISFIKDRHLKNSAIFLDNKTIVTCFPTYCNKERIKWNMASNKSLVVNECKESFKTRHGYIKFCTPRVATLLQFLQYHYHHFHYLILTPSSNLLTTEGTYILVSSTNINCVCRICILSYLFLLRTFVRDIQLSFIVSSSYYGS